MSVLPGPLRPAAVRVLRSRDPAEPHRVATPLELLTDLCFVVAVSRAAATLHHDAAAQHLATGLPEYALAFFAIWWTWLNFTWFASAYDNDDVVYRLLTILQILGSLVLAAGVPHLFEHPTTVIIGYLIMRIALVVQWLRAARHDPARRRTCRRYAVGILIVQAAWVAALLVPLAERLPVFLLLIVADLAVPVIAERAGPTSWHAHHVAERYSLFFIIVLGEVILSSADGISEALGADDAERGHLAAVIVGGVLIVFSVWWLYFSRPAAAVLERGRGAGRGWHYLWGFGHYLIFASAAAVGAGLAARVDHWTAVGLHEGEGAPDSGLGSALLLSGAVAVLLAGIWFFQVRGHDPGPRTAVPFGVAVLAVLAAAFTPFPEVLTGVVCAGLLAVEIVVAGLAPDGEAD